MTAHTPGPWVVTVTDDGGSMVHAPNCAIATVWPAPDSKAGDNRQSAINARLIAAAPEMLEALQRVIRLVGDPEQTLADIVNCAHAAIAKATGGDK